MKGLKSWTALALSLVLMLPAAYAVEPAAAGVIETSCKACILMEAATGEILYSENEHTQLAPASVTKIMTLLLVAEAVDSGRIALTDTVTASEHAAEMGGSQIYLKVGEQMQVEELIKAVVIASANDGAVALAEFVAGSETAFVAQMNQRATELGMNDTHFENCNGLPAEGHLTSAYDIAVMSRELLKHECIRAFTTIWMDSVRDGAFGLTNTNRLVRFYDGCTGLKTGFTNAAGYCISATAQRDGMELIGVVLGSDTSDHRFETAKNLLNYGFANYTLVAAQPDGALPPIEVILGRAAAVQPVLAEEPVLLTEKTGGEVTTRVTLADEVTAPVSAGQELGQMEVLIGGEAVRSIPLVAADDVERLTTWELFQQFLRCLAMTG